LIERKKKDTWKHHALSVGLPGEGKKAKTLRHAGKKGISVKGIKVEPWVKIGERGKEAAK